MTKAQYLQQCNCAKEYGLQMPKRSYLEWKAFAFGNTSEQYHISTK